MLGNGVYNYILPKTSSYNTANAASVCVKVGLQLSAMTANDITAFRVAMWEVQVSHDLVDLSFWIVSIGCLPLPQSSTRVEPKLHMYRDFHAPM